MWENWRIVKRGRNDQRCVKGCLVGLLETAAIRRRQQCVRCAVTGVLFALSPPVSSVFGRCMERSFFKFELSMPRVDLFGSGSGMAI